jgi:protein subunit release factor A
VEQFKIEDVRIDTFTCQGQQGYRMTHKPTGIMVFSVVPARFSHKRKMDMITTLEKQVDKFVAKTQRKEKP